MHLRLLRPFVSLSLAGFALSAVVSAQVAVTTRVGADRQPSVLSRLADDWRTGAMGGTSYLLREPQARRASVVFANLDNVPVCVNSPSSS